ncbi:MAG: nucleotide sugar dehydrogenase [Deltaproteobacteria bacterium]|jgi:UDP-N-acetyl-D-galactosamine dehydrogenase|nr:nucleotide sugar dehydrogenase [Deltaproteobacteria bacterium]
MISFAALKDKESAIAVVGLGYVGLPLACAMSRQFKVIGFDINKERVAALRAGYDHTGEVAPGALAANSLFFTHDPVSLAEAGLIIVAVPTPIDTHRDPDLRALLSASRLVGQRLRPGCVVAYESTVYPGATEDVCRPVLERESGLRHGRDFFLGYSPERINPGDREHSIDKVVKVVSAADAAALELLALVYGSVTRAGVYKAPSIKVAEAAKVIENTQRDINIALMNELAMIFGKMDISTVEVLKTAGTKWNFLPFEPGLVGGHCIGVDPYYLTYKAEELGYSPEVILAGRRINDRMGKMIAGQCVKLLSRQGVRMRGASIGILGFTFKENVPDTRNTRVYDIIRELEDYGALALTHDPLADPAEAEAEYGLKLSPLDALQDLDALVLAVPHAVFRELTLKELAGRFKSDSQVILLDVKNFWDRNEALRLGYTCWSL